MGQEGRGSDGLGEMSGAKLLEGQCWPALVEHGVPPWGSGRPR